MMISSVTVYMKGQGYQRTPKPALKIQGIQMTTQTLEAEPLIHSMSAVQTPKIIQGKFPEK